MVGSMTDITALRITSEALHESQTRYQQVFESVQEVIFQTDARGHWQLLNPAWEDISGYPVAETLGHSFLDYLHPDDRDTRREALRPLVERREDSCTATLRLIRRDGSMRWMDLAVHAIVDGTTASSAPPAPSTTSPPGSPPRTTCASPPASSATPARASSSPTRNRASSR
jgi:PAS domain S-box-containing protein